MTFPPETLALMDAVIAENPSPPIVTKPDLAWRDTKIATYFREKELPRLNLTPDVTIRELTDFQLRSIIAYLWRGDVLDYVYRNLHEYNIEVSRCMSGGISDAEISDIINAAAEKLIVGAVEHGIKSFERNNQSQFFKLLTDEANYRKLSW